MTGAPGDPAERPAWAGGGIRDPARATGAQPDFAGTDADIEEIAKDLGLDSNIRFSRLAVTPEQIRTLALPTAPAKPTDRRSLRREQHIRFALTERLRHLLTDDWDGEGAP